MSNEITTPTTPANSAVVATEIKSTAIPRGKGVNALTRGLSALTQGASAAAMMAANRQLAAHELSSADATERVRIAERMAVGDSRAVAKAIATLSHLAQIPLSWVELGHENGQQSVSMGDWHNAMKAVEAVAASDKKAAAKRGVQAVAWGSEVEGLRLAKIEALKLERLERAARKAELPEAVAELPEVVAEAAELPEVVPEVVAEVVAEAAELPEVVPEVVA